MSPSLARSIPEEGQRKEKCLNTKQLKKQSGTHVAACDLADVVSDIFPTLRKMSLDGIVDLSRAGLISCDTDPNRQPGPGIREGFQIDPHVFSVGKL